MRGGHPFVTRVNNATIVVENATRFGTREYYLVTHLTIDGEQLWQMGTRGVICQ